MKTKITIFTFALTALLLSGCSQNNDYMSKQSPAPNSTTPPASTDVAQATSQPQSSSVPNNAEQETMISADEAKQIALAQVPGATIQDIREFESGYDNGRMNYECKIFYNQKEYQFEIDRYTGAILEWDEESPY